MITSSIDTDDNGYPKHSNKDFDDQVTSFYGFTNDSVEFITNVPRHQFGQPFALEFYYAAVTQPKTSNKSRWPTFQECVKECDADMTASKELITMKYSPILGLLKEAIDTIYTCSYIDPTVGGVSKVAFAAGSGAYGPRANGNMFIGSTLYSDDETNTHTWTQTNSGQFSITELIEKGS